MIASVVLATGFLGADGIRLMNTDYVHRFSKGDLHEYTPKAQKNLDRWADMVTLNVYPKVTSGDGLASAANSVLETYKANKAVVVRTNSVPRKAKKEAEHLIVVLFPRPDFIEASFARFVMHGDVGCSVVYGHRIYGKKAGNTMSVWLQKNGQAIEKSLMDMKVPVAPSK